MARAAPGPLLIFGVVRALRRPPAAEPASPIGASSGAAASHLSHARHLLNESPRAARCRRDRPTPCERLRALPSPRCASTPTRRCAARPSTAIDARGRRARVRRPHPPRPAGASHNTTGGPPATATFFNLPAAKNPMYRLSGDQNGNVPSSVPGIGVAVCAATGRSQIRYANWAPATKTMLRPSGETASCVAAPVPPALGPPNELPSGGAIVN